MIVHTNTECTQIVLAAGRDGLDPADYVACGAPVWVHQGHRVNTPMCEEHARARGGDEGRGMEVYG